MYVDAGYVQGEPSAAVPIKIALNRCKLEGGRSDGKYRAMHGAAQECIAVLRQRVSPSAVGPCPARVTGAQSPNSFSTGIRSGLICAHITLISFVVITL